MKKLILLIPLIGCVQHIHNKDLLTINPGMSYKQVTNQLGSPYELASSKMEKYVSTEAPYLHEALVEIYVYKTHADSTSYLNRCYFVFSDKILKTIKC